MLMSIVFILASSTHGNALSQHLETGNCGVPWNKSIQLGNANSHIDGLVPKRHNPSALAVELPLSCIKLLIRHYLTLFIQCNFIHISQEYATLYFIYIHIDGLVQERHNSSSLAMELHLSYPKLSIWHYLILFIRCNLINISQEYNTLDFICIHIDWLMQERCNSSVLAMELYLSCTNPSIWVWNKGFSIRHYKMYTTNCKSTAPYMINIRVIQEYQSDSK